MVERKPVFIDLTHGVIGKWDGYEESSKEGMVIPRYFPFNSLRVAKSRKYKFAVPEKAVFGPFQPSSADMKGRADKMVVITESNQGAPLHDKIDDIADRRIGDLEERVEDEQWKRSIEERRRKESEDESESERSKREQRSSSRRPDFMRDGGRR